MITKGPKGNMISAYSDPYSSLLPISFRCWGELVATLLGIKFTSNPPVA